MELSQQSTLSEVSTKLGAGMSFLASGMRREGVVCKQRRWPCKPTAHAPPGGRSISPRARPLHTSFQRRRREKPTQHHKTSTFSVRAPYLDSAHCKGSFSVDMPSPQAFSESLLSMPVTIERPRQPHQPRGPVPLLLGSSQ